MSRHDRTLARTALAQAEALVTNPAFARAACAEQRVVAWRALLEARGRRVDTCRLLILQRNIIEAERRARDRLEAMEQMRDAMRTPRAPFRRAGGPEDAA